MGAGDDTGVRGLMYNNLLPVTPLVDIKVIQETLERMGIPNAKEKIIFPSCYLHGINDIFYLCHFKELFLLRREDSYNNISDNDIYRRNSIAFCLKQWKLIDVKDELIEKRDKMVFVLSHEEKKDWVVQHKFNINSLTGR